MKAQKQPRVLIVILNYGTYDLTLKLINELHSDLDYSNYDIMVVDNCSPNESAIVLEENSKQNDYVFFANKENAGYAAGNNIGIRYGIANGYDYTWILNNDVELREKNVLQHMVEIAEQDAAIGGIGPKIFSLDGTPCAPYCRRPSFWSMTGGIITERKYRRNNINTSRSVYRVYGCCMLLKNVVMDKINCMDERTFLYGEEDILAERMKKEGYDFYYDADVSVTHKESASMKRMSSKRKTLQMRENGKSMELYLKEYRKYPYLARKICIFVRKMIIYIR